MTFPTQTARELEPLTIVDSKAGHPTLSWEDLPSELPPRPAPPVHGDSLVSFVTAAGFAVEYDDGNMLHLRPVVGSVFPVGRFVALRMPDEGVDVTKQTMATVAFQRGAGQLYSLQGSADEPCYALVVDERTPGVGVYREWHTLARERHVHILIVRPQAVRAALQAGEAARHFRNLLAQSREDPFRLEGPVEDELEFFGRRQYIDALLDCITVRQASFGLFGLEKWGTTSMLKRLSSEIMASRNQSISWIDCYDIDDLSVAGICRAVIANLHSMESRRETVVLSSLSELPPSTAEGVFSMARSCVGARLNLPPVLFFDRADELVSPSRTDPSAVVEILRILRRWARPAMNYPRLIVVLGGVHDGIVASRQLRIGEDYIANPLWRVVEAHYTPLFTAQETSEFMLRMGVRAGIEIADEAIHAIHDLTGGHKYLCRLMGSELRRRLNSRTGTSVRADLDAVNEAAYAVVLTHHDYFSALIDRAPPATHPLLMRLAQGELFNTQLLGLRSVAQSALPTAGDRLEAIRFLRCHRLVTENGTKYRLAIKLFGYWLKLLGQMDSLIYEKGSEGQAKDEAAVEENDKVPDAGVMPASDSVFAQVARAHNSANGTIRSPPPVASFPVMPDEVIALRQFMDLSFDDQELILLLADLNVRLEEVTSDRESKQIKILRIVEWFMRHGRFAELSHTVQDRRRGRLAELMNTAKDEER